MRSPAPHRGFRRDIQGLRAIAVLAVLVWHLDENALPGGFAGVDVFFVISGYLMTRALLARERLDGRAMADFWARRARRILPAATLVLVATLAAGWIVLPATRREGLANDAILSALYVVNFDFAASTDYLQSLDAPSPFQHYWSLAVEEQFYIVWPLLLAAAAAIAARFGGQRARFAGAAIASVIVLSALASMLWTAADPAVAYFVTPTRLWELALGGLVAVVPPLASRFAGPAAFAALAVAIASLVLLDASDPFPGGLAWWPTLATAIVIWAGSARGNGLVHRALGGAPVQWLGAVSYSVYLWHWPLIVLSNPYDKPTELISARSVLIVVATLALAWLTYRFVEQPMRSRAPGTRWAGVRGGLALGATLLVVTLIVTGSLRLAAPGASTVAGYPGPPTSAQGAQAVPEGQNADAAGESDGYLPDPSDLSSDIPATYNEGCHVNAPQTQPVACNWGSSGPLVVVVGDSHATQWTPALRSLAAERGWRVMAMTKAGCPWTGSSVASFQRNIPYTACNEWNEKVNSVLERERPDLIVTSNAPTRAWEGRALGEGDAAAEASLGRGFADAWGSAIDDGAKVVVIRDTPSPRFSIADCLFNELPPFDACSFSRDSGLRNSGTGQQTGLGLEPRAREVDLNNAVCGASRCSAVVGGVAVYRDRGHLTGTYARSLAPKLEREMKAAGALPLGEK